MSNEDRNSDAFDSDASFYFICSFVCLFSGAIRFAIMEWGAIVYDYVYQHKKESECTKNGRMH